MSRLKIVLFLFKIKLNRFLKMNFRNILLVLMLVFSSILYSQSILVSGIVVDEGGNPLPGVTVLIEGTNRGTSTTFEGTYAIKADNENQNIQFSYISFETQSILIGNQTKIDVIMVESLESLEEVQVVAFQKQKKTVLLVLSTQSTRLS